MDTLKLIETRKHPLLRSTRVVDGAYVRTRHAALAKRKADKATRASVARLALNWTPNLTECGRAEWEAELADATA